MNFAIALLLLFHSTLARKVYTGYSLLRSTPMNQEQVEFLRNVSQEIKIDYWTSPGKVKKPVDMLVGPEEKKRLLNLMDTKGYPYTTVMEDVQRAFDEQTIKPYIRRKMTTFDFKAFYQLGDIYNWLTDLANERPDEVEIITIGETYENRDILAVKVNLRAGRTRSSVIIEGGIHAREWISPAIVCYLLQQVLNYNQSNDSEMIKIAKTYEWYFVPILNPDGYVYTFEQDRLWRKNRRGGFGVDLNRNFDVAFGAIGVSKHQADETFGGNYAFSEKETLAIKDLIEKVEENLEYYIAFHSYGQYIILPYAHLNSHTDNYDEANDILQKAKKKIALRYGTHYSIGTAYDTVGYLTSGVSGCWVKKTFRVPYVATFELRDTGVHGFALPTSYILPTCEETTDGLKIILEPKTPHFTKLQFLENFDFNKQPCCSGNFVLEVFIGALFVVANFDLIIIN